MQTVFAPVVHLSRHKDGKVACTCLAKPMDPEESLMDPGLNGRGTPESGKTIRGPGSPTSICSIHSLRPLRERLELFRDFLEIHRFPLHTTIMDAVDMEGGAANFDYINRHLVFRMRYRENCDGNPSVAFTIPDASFLTRTELTTLSTSPRIKARFCEPRHMRRMTDSELEFAGFLAVCYELEDCLVFREEAVFLLDMDMIPPAEEGFDWMSDLRTSVEMGSVYRKIHDRDYWRMGHLKMIAGFWRWIRFTPDELLARGVPPEVIPFS